MWRVAKGVLCVFSMQAMLFVQTAAFAGVTEEAAAAGRAANASARGAVNAKDAAANVPGYTATPPQRSLYGRGDLKSQASATLYACLMTPDDPVCQAQTGAMKSANTPREAVNAYDPAILDARNIARNPNAVLGDISSFYSGCTTETIDVPPGKVNRQCSRTVGTTGYACRKVLKVDVQTKTNCELGTWFASAEAGDWWVLHSEVDTQCRVRDDGMQRFKFRGTREYHGIPCLDWQTLDLTTAPNDKANVVANLCNGYDSPLYGLPYAHDVAVRMPGSGCISGHCTYNFQTGRARYQCPSGTILGDGENSTQIGQCYKRTDAIVAEGYPCPPGQQYFWGTEVESGGYCVTTFPATVIGAEGPALTLRFEQPALTHTEADAWDDECPALEAGGRCSVSGDAARCTDGPGTRRISGIDITRSCWAYERTVSCSGLASDDCGPLAAAGCTATGSTCVQADASGTCQKYEDTYSCPSPGERVTKSSNCPRDVVCMGDACFNTAYKNDKDFARSMSMLEAVREAGVYLDPDKLEVFKGEVDHCRDKLLKNCCYSDPNGANMSNGGTFGVGSRLVFDILMNSSNRQFVMQGLAVLAGSAGFSGTFTTYGVTIGVGGAAAPAGSVVLASNGNFMIAVDPWTLAVAVVIYVVMQMMACDDEEGLLAMKNGAKLCHEVGDYCSDDIFGWCIEHTHTSCCFNSMISRIVNEQGRGQIHKGWGSAESPDCSGFTVKQLQSLDFSIMDLTEFYSSIVPTLPNADALGKANASKASACYYGKGKC